MQLTSFIIKGDSLHVYIMQKLFTPLGETWERTWYHSKSRYWKQLDPTTCFTDFDSIFEELNRCSKIGKYFKEIQETFDAAGYNKNNPYISGDITCETFYSLLDNAKQLYTQEVGTPTPELGKYLKKPRLTKCLLFNEYRSRLYMIGYGSMDHYDHYENTKWGVGKRHLLYRLEGTIKVVYWLKKKLEAGVPLKDIHYYDYDKERHAQDSTHVVVVLEEALEEYLEFCYREELIRSKTLLAV